MSANSKKIGKRLSRRDSSESIKNKCDSWSLGQNSKSNPILESMGLSILPDASEKDDSCSDNSVSTSPFSEMSVNDRVLQPLSANINHSVVKFHSEQVNDDFFVFKRRRLNSIRGEDKINLLYDEHLLHIFQFLPKYMLARCAQVCKRWKRICFDESLWRRLDLAGKAIKPGVVGRVLIRGAKVLRLSKAEISSPAFCPLLQYLSPNIDIQCKLTHIDLSMAAVEISVLEEIFKVCQQLQKVSLELCSISHLVCQHLSKNPYLNTLNLAMCYNVTSIGLQMIFSQCHNLHVLNLGWTGLDDSELTLICSSLPSNIHQLNISGCRNDMLDEHVMLIVKRCKKLKELDVSDSMKISADALGIIIAQLPDIENLSFSRCYGIIPKMYLGLKKLRNLLHLNIFGIFSESDLVTVKSALCKIEINRNMFSSVARPTVGIRRTSIWGQRVRDRFS